MDNQEVIRALSGLVRIDIDAAHAYDQAIQRIDVADVKAQVTEYREQHLRHITDLSNVIRELGGKPPEFSRDFKGYLIEGFTALRSVTGTEGALKAMRGNEKLTNRKYEEARDLDLPPAVRTVVDRNLRDERTHLRYIEEAIDSKVWE